MKLTPPQLAISSGVRSGPQPSTKPTRPVLPRLCGRFSGYLVLFLIAAAAGCGLTNDRQFIEHSLVSPTKAPPKSVSYLSGTVIDSTRLALAWVDRARSSRRLWTMVVEYGLSNTMTVLQPPAVIDSGNIVQADIFTDGTTYGLLYTKDYQLQLRRPWNTPPVLPFAPQRPFPRAASALVGPDSTLTIVTFVLQSEPSGVANKCVALTVRGTHIHSTHLGTAIMPGLGHQPAPQLRLNGDTTTVALLIPDGSYTSALTDEYSAGSIAGRASAYARIQLVPNLDGTMHAQDVDKHTLSADHDLKFARELALIDPIGATVAITARRTYIVASADSSATRRISSTAGSGANESVPRTQALAVKGGTLLVWIDAAHTDNAIDVLRGRVASQFGAELHATMLSGPTLVANNVPGFPIRTQAQCITLHMLRNAPVLAWIEASDRWTKDQRLPVRICVRRFETIP